MKIALVIFSKTPGLSQVKSRLAKDLGEDFAKEFYTRSIYATKAYLDELEIEGTKVDIIWALAEDKAHADELWKKEATILQGEGELAKRLEKVEKELSSHYDALFFLGADSPHLSSLYLKFEIKNYLESKSRYLLGRCIDGGFYIFGFKGALPEGFWGNIEYSSENTADQLLAQISEVMLLREDHDIDTFADIKRLLGKKPKKATGSYLELYLWLKSKQFNAE